MRSLNTSLPRSPKKKRRARPAEQLIQDFKTAALSVTNLYKTAATDQRLARETGYQEALDDLLIFLDKENIGLGDGEGWRIRQWATERLDGSPPVAPASDSEDERGEAVKIARSSSPPTQKATGTDQAVKADPTASPSDLAAIPALMKAQTSVQTLPNAQPSSEDFTFRSAHQYPQDVDMQTPSEPLIDQATTSPPVQTLVTPAVRVEVVPRTSRTPHRSGNYPNRHNNRSNQNTRLPPSLVGSKRRLPFPDYFDIGSFGDGRDGQNNGGKKSRFS